MKIVRVHHHYWPVVSMLRKVAKMLTEGMVEFGHEVHVVTSRYGAEGKIYPINVSLISKSVRIT